LVEITGFIGRYAALAGILNSFEVLPGPDAEPLAIPMPNAPGSREPASPPRAIPRVVLITQRGQVAEDHRAIYDAVAKARGNLRGPYSILMYSPKLCMLISEVSRYLRRRSLVKPNACELCIIAVAREKDCPYVWASHSGAARKAGVSEEAIVAVRGGGELAALRQDEADIVDYVRQLQWTHHVAQPLFDRLRERYGIPWLVEFTATIGHYGMVTAQINAFEVAPRSDADLLPL
jgi:AhpD family alkylhydroperoxidase